MGEVKRIALAEFGLMTVEEAAAHKGCDPATVRRWVGTGLIPALVVGSGRSAKYLVRRADVGAFVPRAPGAPAGNQNAKREKEPPPKKAARNTRKQK